MGKEGSQIISIADIGDIVEDDELNDPNEEMRDAQIVSVAQLDKYMACLGCKARVEPSSLPLGRCSKSECAMLHRILQLAV